MNRQTISALLVFALLGILAIQQLRDPLSTLSLFVSPPSPVPTLPAGIPLSPTGGLPDFIALDLDNNGLDLVAMDRSTAFFDLDRSDTSERIGWVQPGDGILVVDRNGDGEVNDGAELFGNDTTLPTGLKAADGFAALAQLDDNHDGVLNKDDAGFGTLQIWRDLKQDGFSKPGELSTLAQAGIVEINLASHPVPPPRGGRTDRTNNIVSEGTYMRSDGMALKLYDVVPQRNRALTHYHGKYELSFDALMLPRMRGYGTLKDLTIAVCLDPALMDLVKNFVAGNADDIIKDPITTDKAFDDILFHWARVDTIKPDTRGPNVNAQHLAFMENYLGAPFLQNGAHPNPGPNAGRALEQAWQELRLTLKTYILFQGPLQGLMPKLNYDPAPDAMVGSAIMDEDYLEMISNIAQESGQPDLVWSAIAGELGVIKKTIGFTAEQQQQLDATMTASGARPTQVGEHH